MTSRKAETDASQVVQKIGEDNRRYTRDLLTENENLRYLVAALRHERQELLETLREEQARHLRVQEGIQKEIAEIESRNRRFSEGYVEVEKRNNDLMNLYVASYRLHGTVDREEVIGVIQEIVANLVGCEECGIFELSPESNELKLLSSVGIDATAYETVRLGEGVIGRVALEGESYVADLEAVDPSASGTQALTACIPLKLNGRVTGAIALFRLLPQKPALESADHEMFDLLATHAATALYCTSLHARHGSAVAEDAA